MELTSDQWIVTVDSQHYIVNTVNGVHGVDYGSVYRVNNITIERLILFWTN